MKRFGQIIAVNPNDIDEYERLHAEPPRDVLEILSANNITNYSIYRHRTMLFQYFEYHGSDFDQDMKTIAASRVTQKWWDICKPLQQPLPDRADGEWWLDMPEIFHLA